MRFMEGRKYEWNPLRQAWELLQAETGCSVWLPGWTSEITDKPTGDGAAPVA